jgi:hypothetical protein
VSALPKRPRGRPNGTAEALYLEEVSRFCARLMEIKSHKPSPGAWARLGHERGTASC